MVVGADVRRRGLDSLRRPLQGPANGASVLAKRYTHLQSCTENGPQKPTKTNVYGLVCMFLRACFQWSEIGMNGVEKGNYGNRWQPIPGNRLVLPACLCAVGTRSGMDRVKLPTVGAVKLESKTACSARLSKTRRCDLAGPCEPLALNKSSKPGPFSRRKSVQRNLTSK